MPRRFRPKACRIYAIYRVSHVALYLLIFLLWACPPVLAFNLPSNKKKRLASLHLGQQQKTSLDHVVSARTVAIDAMRKSSSTAFVIDKLDALLSQSNLSGRDRSFARLLITTCVRRLGQIDRVLEMCENKKPKNEKGRKQRRLNETDRLVQAVLRMGAVQLLFLAVPPHAAVKESVDVLRMSRELQVPEAKIKYVNAVLRRIGREGGDLLAKTDITDNAADWFVQELTKSYGPEAAHGVIQSAMIESPRCLTVKHSPDDTVAEQREKLDSLASCFEDSIFLPQGSLMVVSPPPGKISGWPLYDQGEWWLQDVSATLPAIALHNTLGQRESPNQQNVVDLCAAPGGKTAQLCNFGYNVTAVELSSRRSKRLHENMDRLGFDCQIIVADGSEWIPQMPVHGVLLDAPCTATGTGSKRPDVLRKPGDYKELLDIQFKLLCHAADDVLTAGGILAYATCSLLSQESEAQIQKLLSRESSTRMRTLPFQPGEIPGFDDCIDTNGWLRIVPGSRPRALKHVDGFFVARLEKEA